MRARAPASSANLGPGFDTLAVALALYVEVEVTPADRLVVRSYGYGAELPADATHLAARVASDVAGTDRLAVTVRSEIPVGRGLGSSAAVAVAAAAAAGGDDPLRYGAAADGHPENAAASALGGLTTATIVDGVAVARRLPLDPGLGFVVVVPERSLPTAEARAALPVKVSHEDAAFNLGRLGLMIAGLADRRELVAAATDDRLHQGARTALFPEAPEILLQLRRAGALASCWSGAGPSMLGICEAGRAGDVAGEVQRWLSTTGTAGVARSLAADLAGVTILAS